MENGNGVTAVGDWCLWLYGVVEAGRLDDAQRESRGSGLDHVTFVRFQNLACAATKVLSSDYSGIPQGGPERVDWLAPRAMRHHQTLQSLMAFATVIPFKFGSICASLDQVRGILCAQCDHLTTLLTRLQGLSEWSVRIFADEKKVLQLLHDTDPQLQAVSALMASRSPGETYLLGRKRQNLASLLANARYLSLEQDAYDRLQHCAADVAASRRSFAQSEPSLIEVLSTAVLIDSQRFTELRNVLEAIEHDYTPLGVAAEASGPWPPYSFSGIEFQTVTEGN